MDDWQLIVSSNKILSRIFWVVLLSLCLSPVRSDPVVCTVGVNGTFATIQDGLTGCNGGMGSIQLILDGIFTEDLIIQEAITNVTFTSAKFAAGNATAWPEDENITSIIIGTHDVMNASAAVFFQGIKLEGQNLDRSLFLTPLINNNITLDRCLVSNFASNTTIQVSGCKRAVLIRILNSRFKNIWGSAIYAEGMEDVEIRSNIFAGCGGHNNNSCVYAKLNFVSEGFYIVTNNTHWLLADTQPASCVYLADQNGYTRCNNGTIECYNVLETERLRPNCKKQSIPYVLEGTNTTVTDLDYPLECRVYRPCRCADVLFENTNTSRTFVLPVGDLFFKSGLRLNCSVENGTTSSLNASSIVFLESFAGSDGIGQSPPTSDPTMGWSLGPNGLYLEGTFINNSVVECNCTQRNSTAQLQDVGLECDYPLNGTETLCKNGTVKNCTYEFVRCFPLEDEALQYTYGILTNASALAAYCDTNSSLIQTNVTSPPSNTSVACNISTALDLDPSLQTTVIGNYLCLGAFANDTTYKILLEDLDQNVTLSTLCNSSSPGYFFGNGSISRGSCDLLLAAQNVTQNVTQTSNCSSCNATKTIDSKILVVQACRPYYCPATYNISCMYLWYSQVQNTTVNATVVYNVTVTDGIPLDTVNGTYPDGSPLCPTQYEVIVGTIGDVVNATNQTTAQRLDPVLFSNLTADICAEQGATPGYVVPEGNTTAYGSLINGTLVVCYWNISTLVNGTIGCGIVVCSLPTFNSTFNTSLVPPFPYNVTAPRCGVNFTCEDLQVASCSCQLDRVTDCLVPYVVGNQAAAYHFDNIVNETSLVDVTNNRANGLYIGLRVDRTKDFIIYNTSVAETEFADESAVLREIIKQGNLLIWGRDHDAVYGLPGEQIDIASYRRICDSGCPQPFTKVEDFDCKYSLQLFPSRLTPQNRLRGCEYARASSQSNVSPR